MAKELTDADIMNESYTRVVNIAVPTTLNPSIIIDKVDEDYLCQICFELPVSPVNLPCGKTFCDPCIRASMDKKTECPHCRAPYTLDDIAPSHFVAGKIAGLTAGCHNMTCIEKVLIGKNATSYLKHCCECPHNNIRCVHCNVQIKAADVIMHNASPVHLNTIYNKLKRNEGYVTEVSTKLSESMELYKKLITSYDELSKSYSTYKQTIANWQHALHAKNLMSMTKNGKSYTTKKSVSKPMIISRH